MNYSVEKNHDAVIVRMEKSLGKEYLFLLSGDRHIDSPYSDHTLQKKHLDDAAEKNARIIDIGDVFDSMQGRNDPRRKPSDIRPEHNVDNYFDSIVSSAYSFFQPYAKNFILIGKGNHEQATLKNSGTSLQGRLCKQLNVIDGGYSGWVFFRFDRKNGGGSRETIKMRYHHGHGGGGEVTKGVLQAQRRAVYLPDADIVLSGHIHEHWVLPVTRERISANGKAYLDEQTHICVPTYKEEYLIKEGFHTIKGGPPKPLGAVWLKFYFEKGRIKYDVWKAK